MHGIKLIQTWRIYEFIIGTVDHTINIKIKNIIVHVLCSVKMMLKLIIHYQRR